jgi:nicotinamide-nucleotide adenylyltransferase
MTQSHETFDVGVIHGRFQMLHNDHLKYLLAGKARCRHLVVGITNPELSMTQAEDVDSKRSTPLANPLTYYERYQLVRSVLVEAGIALLDFSIVPLPISEPSRYHNYVPMDAVFFLSIYDDWGRRKRDYFKSIGLKTFVLREVTPEEKGISATDIRASILSGEPWRHLVPKPVATLVEEWNVAQRLREIQSRRDNDEDCGGK